MNEYYAITWRPRKERFDINTLPNFLKEWKLTEKALVCIEDDNHQHSFIKLNKQVRNDSVRRAICNGLRKAYGSDANEITWGIALRIQSVKEREVDNSVAYICKDGNVIMNKGFSEEYIEERRLQYAEHANRKENQKNYSKSKILSTLAAELQSIDPAEQRHWNGEMLLMRCMAKDDSLFGFYEKTNIRKLNKALKMVVAGPEKRDDYIFIQSLIQMENETLS